VLDTRRDRGNAGSDTAREVVVVIDIDESGRVELYELVDARLRNLSTEIRHTDSPSLRRDLRNERETLRSLVAQLAPRAEAVG
jgi:hypothetical protein